MTQYDLFPGVYLMYNDFHMESYDSVFPHHGRYAVHRLLPPGEDGVSGGTGHLLLCGGRGPEAGPPAGTPGPLHLSALPLPRHYHRVHPAPRRPVSEGVGAGVPSGSGATPGEILRRPSPQGDPRGALCGSHLPGALRGAGADQTALLPASRCWNCCCTWTPWNWTGGQRSPTSTNLRWRR